MSSLKTIQKLPQQELEIWEGGRIKMPVWITGERRGPYRRFFKFETCLLALPPKIKKHNADIRVARHFEEEVPVETFHG